MKRLPTSDMQIDLNNFMKKYQIEDSTLKVLLEDFSLSSVDNELRELKQELQTYLSDTAKSVNDKSLDDLLQGIESEIVTIAGRSKQLSHQGFDLLQFIADFEKHNLPDPHHRKKLNLLSDFAKETNGLHPGYYIFGADANIGKTTSIITLAVDIVMSIHASKILIFTFDDSKLDFWKRLVACMSGYLNVFAANKDYVYGNTQIRINNVLDVHSNPKHELLRQDSLKLINKFIKTKIIDIYDRVDGNNFAFMQTKITKAIQEHGRDNVFVFIDAARKIRTPSNLKTQVEREEYRADELDILATSNMIPLLTSHEVIKNPDRKKLTLADLKGSANYQYNAKFVGLLYPRVAKNEHGKWETINNQGFMDAAKNKLSSFKGTFQMQTINASCFLSNLIIKE